MPSITSWTRLEPRARDETLSASLQARIQDPLWLLARQWQFGEFGSEDVGSPVKAELQIDYGQLERYCPGSPNADLARDYDNQVPLETRVEREPVLWSNKVSPRLAAEAGLQLFRFFGASLTDKFRGEFLKRYALDLRSAQDEHQLDGASLRFMSVLAGRVLDGARLYGHLGSLSRQPLVLPQEEPFSKMNDNELKQVTAAIENWLAWYEALFSEPQGDAAWVPQCMEYSFAVSAPIKSSGTPDELVLVASEYSEGHLDWHSFEIDTEPTHKLGARGQEFKSRFITVIPTPVRFRGMPASRWWEFEDAGVNLGGVEAAREDLARLLLTEFALIYGNDFFVIPIDLEVGSICRVNFLQVTNTFGEIASIAPASQADQMNLGAAPWRMFCLSTLNERLAKQKLPTEFLFLPPVLGWNLESEPVEKVLLLRDEMANMAWAIESMVEGTAGGALNRFETYQQERQRQEREKEQAKSGSTAPPSGPLGYRLASSVPPYWLPLIPEHTNSANRNIVLRLFGQRWGKILSMPSRPLIRPLIVNEEQVPREGVRVMRACQYARWIDGSTHLWVGRRKETGRGEGSSGLRFDVVEPGQQEV